MDGRLLAPTTEATGDSATTEGATTDDHVEIQLEQEAADIKVAPAPTRPSEAEVEEHRITHFPYRSWCDECREGRGLGEQRGRHAGRPHEIPRVGIDYWYITTGGIQSRRDIASDFPEDAAGETLLTRAREDEKLMKCLIIRCHESKAVFAHAVPVKGRDEDNYVANLITTDVAFMGHVKLIIKSDNEPALLALAHAALLEIKCQVQKGTLQTTHVSVEHSAEHESASNGGTECGIRQVRGLFRTIKRCTEKRIEQAIPPTHPLATWLVEHAALLINACAVGQDGKTAWKRLRGRDFGQRLVGFGEGVMYKQPPKGPQHDTEGNMAPRMFPGIFLGYHYFSNTYRVATESGDVVRVRSLMRRPMADRWQAAQIKSIRTTPWTLRATAAPARIELGEHVAKHESGHDEHVPQARRLKITLQTLAEYGTTDGCPQCRHVRMFGETKPGLAHSEPCRHRIVEAMRATAEGAARLERQDNRAQRTADEQADVSERHAQRSGQGGQGEQSAQIDGDGTVPAPPSDGGVIRDDDETPAPVEAPTPANNDGNDDEMQIGSVITISDINAQISRMVADDHSEEFETEVIAMMTSLGANPGSFAREKKSAMKRIVMELYSPPRVTSLLREMTNHGLTPGLALDLTTTDADDGQPWNFNDPAKRDKALRMIRKLKPLFVIGSPMCTRWSSWQHLNDAKRCPDEVKREKLHALVHLEFMAQIYREQIEGGRMFLHEHPESATSWGEQCIRDIMQIPGVERAVGHQCQYGQQVQRGKYKDQPVRKATGWMSNAPRLLARLDRKCLGQGGQCTRPSGGKHVMASGHVAREAAVYPRNLCKAIIRGMMDEMHSRGIWRPGEVGMHAVADEDNLDQTIASEKCSGAYRDDISGQLLRDDLVKEARAKELQYFAQKGVWVKRPKHEARQRTGKGAISVRWVDVNKGDDLHPKYRSRLVARQLKAHDKSGASFFAPTPPLEALRTVLSLAATKVGEWQPCYSPKSDRRTQVSLIDISRAYFNAKIDPGVETYVQLPPEDDESEHMVGKLMRHMYGTRAAADGWQEEYSAFLVEHLGMNQGQSSPCVFRHPTREIVMTVHGDDFTSVGAKRDLDWLEAQMQEHYELTIQPRLGPGPDDAKEAVILNRIIRWGSEGIEYEADPRQVEKLIAECGMADTNSVATPGVRASFEQTENDSELPPHLHTAFRGSAARANYLAADRPDCQFAAKEICRWMSKPTQHAWQALKRLCRYLVGLPRLIMHFRWQEVDQVDVYTDTDWAGCPRTRKSTSGGCVVLGVHPVKSWSSTQTSVALSSGEAEFNGVVRGAGVGLGYQSLLRDLGIHLKLRVWTDSSAAVGICSRQGLGKLRHLDTHTLWIQQAVRSKRVDLRKVAGEVNPADLFTKHSLTRERLIDLSKLYELEFRGGRAASAPTTRKTAGTRSTMAEVHAMTTDTTQTQHHNTTRDHDGNTTEDTPIMPHRMFSEEDLNRIYPSIEAVDAVDGEDEPADALLEQGERVAKEIMEQANSIGRKRIADS